MSLIGRLELLFNLEKNNFRTKEDCLVAVLHCLFINQNLQCVGTGDEWPQFDQTRTEMLPKDWNSTNDVYSLRYSSKDCKSRYLLKIVKADHMLHVNVVLNENKIASMTLPINSYVTDDYSEYTTAYKDLDSLNQNFQNQILKQFEKPCLTTSNPPRRSSSPSREYPPNPRPLRSPLETEAQRNRFQLPQVGGSDLDPFGFGRGGMLLDPSNFGAPARPNFGMGGRGGLPRGVPPGARFDPFSPPGAPFRFNPDPDHFKPPDYDFT